MFELYTALPATDGYHSYCISRTHPSNLANIGGGKRARERGYIDLQHMQEDKGSGNGVLPLFQVCKPVYCSCGFTWSSAVIKADYPVAVCLTNLLVVNFNVNYIYTGRDVASAYLPISGGKQRRDLRPLSSVANCP